METKPRVNRTRIKCNRIGCQHWINPNTKHFANDPEKKPLCRYCKQKDKIKNVKS